MYAELLAKSNFSFLRGASDSRDYVERASELRMPAVGIVDINGVYAIPRAYEVTKAITDVKLIVGSELTLSDHPPIALIARDRGAYAVLCQTITKLHAGKEKGKGSLTLDQLMAALEGDPRSSGLVAIPNHRPTTAYGPLKDFFGEKLYLPICQYLDGMDRERTEEAVETARQYDLPLVAHNDVHYHVPSRKMLQDCLACIREGVTLKTAGKKIFKNNERYLKSPLQVRALFKDLPLAIRSTLDIAESCTFNLSELAYTYPVELVPEGHTAQSYLEEMVLKGAHRIYRGIISEKVDGQIRKEFELVKKMNYAGYFLTIFDIVEFSRSRNIICQGRGSAANSVICYCLGITAIDPVRMNLLVERFISEGRSEPPDIDVDFEHNRREEVIQYIYQRYGRHRAAMVSAIRTYQKKSSFLELSKAIGVPVGVMSANALARDFDQIAGDLKSKRPLIEALADDLVDFPRHLSIHSGGFTLSQDPISEIVPIEPARMENRTIIQWDKNDLDTIGLLKLDILSLGFLTALHYACEYLGIHWHQIPPEDPETYAMIGRAETEGCFQIESRAQKAMLPKTLPVNLYDLTVQVAIVRPGPGVGSMIPVYLKRREAARRGQPYVLPSKDLEPIIGRTYGIPLFQEMVMAIAIQKAGFNDREANDLRRSIAAARSADGVSEVGVKLHAGLVKSGLPLPWIDELCHFFKGFAAYNFPESHAASFASIAYASAYLKCHHPAEFLCALVNAQPMGFYAVDTLINDAKRNGVKVLPIHPNLSDWDAKMEGQGRVRMGFQNVRRIREEDIRWMSAEKERELQEGDIQTKITQDEMKAHFLVLEVERAQEPFSSLYDFVKRTKLSREVIELMAMADVFSCFGSDRRHTFWQSISYHGLFRRAESSQLSLFEKDPALESSSDELFPKMTLFQTIVADYRALGYSVDGNLMTALRKSMPTLPKTTSVQAKSFPHGKRIHYAGILSVNQRPPTAKGVAFLTVEDDEGSLDFILKKEIYERYEPIIVNSRFLELKGSVQRSGTGISIIVSEVGSFLVEGESKRSITHGATSRMFGSPVGGSPNNHH
ncbi:MAG: error-prone DNA polymerase [Cryobacterium sp.]|nr:error-prone DNA polymerase [Oligoflexia bacterium]